MLIFVVLFTLFLCLCHYLCYHNRDAKLLAKIPGSTIKFLVGNAFDIKASPTHLFSMARNAASASSGIYRFHAFPIAAVNIYNPDDIEILTSNMKYHEKSDLYKFLKPWLQDGLLLSKGLKWQQRRKILTPAFHFNVLQKYYVSLQDNSQQLLKTLTKLDGKTVDITTILSEYTLNAICETAMGTQLSKDNTGAGKTYKDAIYAQGELLVYRFARIYFYIDSIFNLSATARRQLKYLSVIHDFTKNVIEQRRVILDEEKVNSNEITGSGDGEYMTKKRKNTAMLDLMIMAAKDGLIDNKGIQEEVDTFMVEGHDTTAVGLIYCLLMLANKKNIQEKIFEELNSIFGNDTRAATTDDLASMRYLECCIKESLRLYPPVPFISRRINVDTVLSGYTVPAGTDCHIHIYDLHRLESLYKNALEFDPDRFLPENCVGRHNYAYIPFSAGPRNCIGQKFAMMEMKSAISTILRNFKLVPITKPSDLRLFSDIVIRNSEPVLMKFIKR